MSLLLTDGKFRAFDDDGTPLAGGLLYTYVSGTTTPKATYEDAGLTQLNTNPIVFDSRGEANVWLDGGAYSLELLRADSSLVWTQDGVIDSSGELQSDLVNKTDAGKGDALIGWSSIYTIVSGVLTRYSSVGEAVTALGATAGTIVVRANTSVAADLTIPSTAGLRIENCAQISVASGVTLTINGDCDAPNVRVFTGSGSVVFGNGSRAKAPRIWFGTIGAVYDTARLVLQTDSDTTGPVHAYEDNNHVQMTHSTASNFNAYASFDANPLADGTGTYDHVVGFQARPTYSGSGGINQRQDGFNWLLTHTGAGAITTARGFHAENPLGSGTINLLAGFLCEYLNRGAETHGFFSATPLNTVRVSGGLAATWMLQGNGQSGGFGLSLQSRADSTAHVLNTANTALLFGTNNVYTGACTADGRWKMSSIGLTDILSANQQLEVQGVGAATFSATGAATVATVLNWHQATTGNNLFQAFYTDGTATLRGSIDYNRAGTAVRFNTTSDARLKTNIADAPEAGPIIDAIKVRSYDWKGTGNHTDFQFVAQELHGVFPDAVREGDAGDEPTDIWGVDPSKLVGLLLREVQSLRSRLAAGGL